MSDYSVRIECTFEDLAGTWIEVKDRGWTLAVMDGINGTAYSPAGVVDLVHKYVTACNIQILDGPAVEAGGPKPAGPITEPRDLTEDILRYYMDARILNFLIGAIYEGARHTFSLAPFAVRVSSDSYAVLSPNGAAPAPAAKGPKRKRQTVR